MGKYHIAISGDSLSGKTSFINFLKDGSTATPPVPKPILDQDAPSYYDDDDDYSSTPDGNHSFSVSIDGKERNLSVLDGGRVSSGGRMDMTYYTIPMQFTNANAILICYDTSYVHGLRRSFRLLQLAQTDAGIYGVPVFLVGLQIDQRAASHSFEAAQKEANEHLCDSYYECSAKTGEGVNNVIEAIFHELDAIAARDGEVPVIPSSEVRQADYKAQRKASKPKAASSPPPVQNSISVDAPKAVKNAPVLKKVKGGARPHKQANPCVIQ